MGPEGNGIVGKRSLGNGWELSKFVGTLGGICGYSDFHRSKPMGMFVEMHQAIYDAQRTEPPGVSGRVQ